MNAAAPSISAASEKGPWRDNVGAGPLAGLRVVDLTINVLGPVCTQILGDMGADVIKVESPEGDQNRSIGPARQPGMSALYMSMNRNKRSVVLNLKKPAAKEALRRLVASADVFVHSMRPGAATRLGVDYAAIAAINPRIVYGYAPGYRRTAPTVIAPPMTTSSRARADWRRCARRRLANHDMFLRRWPTSSAATFWPAASAWRSITASAPAKGRRLPSRCLKP